MTAPGARATLAFMQPESVTELLIRAGAGDAAALQSAYAAMYQELKRVARRQLRSGPGPLETTALVHETYLKLTGGQVPPLNDRNHLLALAATTMREVLVDHARHLRAQKRGGGQAHLTLTDDIAAASGMDLADLLEVDQRLKSLEAFDARAAKVVELLCFGGYDVAEIAEILQVADYTVRRDWRKARAFLAAGLSSG
jgi:RNA polymerase sigma factor (TIGR02999 family)